MPTVGFGRLNADATHEELVERVAKLEKTLEYLFSGLDTKNIREVSGWRVRPTELVSRDGDVGMSTEDTGGDDIRIFAGAPGGNKENALFIVRKSGKTTIRTASGFPRTEIDPQNNLIAAYSAPDSYVAIMPDYNGNIPTIVWVHNGETKAFVYRNPIIGGLNIGTFDGESMNFQPSGSLQINSNNGYTGTITYVKSVASDGQGNVIPFTGTITVNNGLITNAT